MDIPIIKPEIISILQYLLFDKSLQFSLGWRPLPFFYLYRVQPVYIGFAKNDAPVIFDQTFVLNAIDKKYCCPC